MNPNPNANHSVLPKPNHQLKPEQFIPSSAQIEEAKTFVSFFLVKIARIFTKLWQSYEQTLLKPISIAPLVTFRILFGVLTLISSVRFLLLGWIEAQYESSVVKFSYYGFEWVKYPGKEGMYLLYGCMILGSIGILLGAWYRIAAALFFLAFTYTELIDKTYYLNHYYFVSLVALLMVFLPASAAFSIDANRKPSLRTTTCPSWCIRILQFQLFVVYFYAGLAKIHYDWLIEAMPLRLWLPAQDTTPLIGDWLHEPALAYILSWAGMLFDCTIIFALIWHKTRVAAWIAIVVFHSLTGYWFQIGVFPIVMTALTLIFFSEQWHIRVLNSLGRWLRITKGSYFESIKTERTLLSTAFPLHRQVSAKRLIIGIVGVYMIVQMMLPWRFLLYGGNVFWHEAGYRFSWRVMLVEKSGTATFYVQEGASGTKKEVFNKDFLNAHQEKQMSFQPDMILQYAHYLAAYYKKNGLQDPHITADVFVTMNGRPSQRMVNPIVNLAAEQDGLLSNQPYHWVLKYEVQ